jgi:hypothetical protein
MKKNLKPYKLSVTPGYYDSEGNYHQNRNDLPFDAPRNQWTAKIGSIGDAIEKAIDCGEYTVKEIAYLASTKTGKVYSHIGFLKEKNFDVVNKDGIIKFNK